MKHLQRLAVVISLACLAAAAAGFGPDRSARGPRAGEGGSRAGRGAGRPETRRCRPTPIRPRRRWRKSPRHGEWVDIKLPDGGKLVTWVVYPESKSKAGVVIVIHEIFGLTDWVRGVADQFAKEGFIAVAPDLLSGKGPNGGGTDSLGEDVGEGHPHPHAGNGRRALERRARLRAEAPGRQRKGRLGRLLLGRHDELRICRGAAQAECGRRLLRHLAVGGRGLRDDLQHPSSGSTAATTRAWTRRSRRPRPR